MRNRADRCRPPIRRHPIEHDHPFHWTDSAYQTPALDDLIVYELDVEQFNDTFDGVIDRLPYLQSPGVNYLELMPVTPRSSASASAHPGRIASFAAGRHDHF